MAECESSCRPCGVQTRWINRFFPPPSFRYIAMTPHSRGLALSLAKFHFSKTFFLWRIRFFCLFTFRARRVYYKCIFSSDIKQNATLRAKYRHGGRAARYWASGHCVKITTAINVRSHFFFYSFIEYNTDVFSTQITDFRPLIEDNGTRKR